MQRLLILGFILLGINGSVNAQVSNFDTTKYSIKDLQKDFKYMRSKIQDRGTVVYLYNSKKATDRYLDSMYNCIQKPMTAIEFFRFIAPLQAFVKDVHTSISPSAAIRNSFMNNSYLLPFQVELLEKKMYIETNFSSCDSLNGHPQVLSINGVEIEKIIEKCALNLPRDGWDQGHPLFWLNKNFFYYYYFVYGPSATYTIEVKRPDGTEVSMIVPGMDLKTIWEVEDRLISSPERRNVYHHVIDSMKTVVLTLNTFSDPEIKATHKASFRKLINAEFDTILATGYSNLIIDIRNNDGGNSGDAKKVMRYLLHKPFQMKKSVQVVQNKKQEDLLKRNRTAWYGQFQRGTYRPHKQLFNGKVYMLVNEGSTSAAVVFAATMRRNDAATFIGTEMGGNPIVMGGGIWDNVKEAPNTKITFSYGNKLNILDDLKLNTGRGLIPDFTVEQNYNDFIQNKDTQLLFTLNLIGKKL